MVAVGMFFKSDNEVPTAGRHFERPEHGAREI